MKDIYMIFMKTYIFVFITLIELLLYTDCHIMSKEIIAIKLIMKFEFFLELIALIGLSSYLLVKAGISGLNQD